MQNTFVNHVDTSTTLNKAMTCQELNQEPALRTYLMTGMSNVVLVKTCLNQLINSLKFQIPIFLIPPMEDLETNFIRG